LILKEKKLSPLMDPDLKRAFTAKGVGARLPEEPSEHREAGQSRFENGNY
jgi:hypothetical protein